MYFIWSKPYKTVIYIKLTSFDAEIGASKKKSHNLEHQQENKHEQSEYLFLPDVTTTKSRSAKHGNGKAVGFWSDKRVGSSNRDCPFLKTNRNINRICKRE